MAPVLPSISSLQQLFILVVGGVHCFTNPTIGIMNSASGSGSGMNGPSWASAASSSHHQQSPPRSSHTGVDLSRYAHPRQQQQPEHYQAAPPPQRQRAPIYVPIGPPCAGKTTVLSRILVDANDTATQQLQQQQQLPASHHTTASGRTAGRDVSIDDQEGVYLQIPTQLFLVDDPKSIGQPKAKGDAKKLLNQTVHGKRIYERLYLDGANDELRAVLRRLAGKLTKEEFRETIQRQLKCSGVALPTTEEEREAVRSVGRHGGPMQIPPAVVAQCLVDAVEYYAEAETLSSSGKLRDENHPILGPDGCTDLFILEAIFRSSNVVEGGRSRPSGLNLALSKMERLACNASALSPDVPLAWGNTNTRPREYVSALQVAQKSLRPIIFLPHVNPAVVSVQGEEGPASASGFLHHVELDELYRRSIGRLITSGRYVPATAIKDAAFRCDSLMLSAKAEMNRMFPPTQPHVDPRRNEVGNKQEGDVGENTFTKFQLECSLAKLAGYQMNADRTVVKLHDINDDSSNRNRNRQRGGGGGRGGGNTHGNGGRGGGRGRGRGNGYYGQGHNNHNSGCDWDSQQGQRYGGRGGGNGRKYGGGRDDGGWTPNDQHKRSLDGNRRWSPNRY